VRLEIDVDLAQHRLAKPMLADGNDGMQVMRLRAERSALRGC
jgi:hypothetical protein